MRSEATIRYNWRFSISMSLYVSAILGVTWIFKHRTIPSPSNYILAVLPSLPVIAVIVFFGMYLAEEKDDFQRTILVTSSLWATGVLLAVATFWGFLENYVEVVHIPMYWAFVLWSVALGVVQPILRRRYR